MILFKCYPNVTRMLPDLLPAQRLVALSVTHVTQLYPYHSIL